MLYLSLYTFQFTSFSLSFLISALNSFFTLLFVNNSIVYKQDRKMLGGRATDDKSSENNQLFHFRPGHISFLMLHSRVAGIVKQFN